MTKSKKKPTPIDPTLLNLHEIMIHMNDVELLDDFKTAVKICKNSVDCYRFLQTYTLESVSRAKTPELPLTSLPARQSLTQRFVKIDLKNTTDVHKYGALIKGKLLLLIGAKGLTLTELAKLTKIAQPSLSRFFNHVESPRVKTILKIASALGLREIEIETQPLIVNSQNKHF